ncbi:MAG: (2Fe-2S)-binding protein [Gammaproteobacteria bacterium]|nr:(2Fe-2S)-binding protein [Gammaproteobacteria bacterium]
MYICICNAITDSQIREAAQAGVDDLWGLQAELGVATYCGSCKETASEILRENRIANRRAEPRIYEPAVG